MKFSLCIREYCQPEIPTLESAILLCKMLDMKIMINVVHSFYYSSLDEVFTESFIIFRC